MENKIVFLCGARDFHAMDWYKSAKEEVKSHEVVLLTDLIQGEGFKKIIDDTDKVYELLILDKFLFKKQSKIGHIWRNLLKLMVLPIQVKKLKNFAKQYPNSKFHAHSMYYLWLGWLAKVDFVGTPQGSDILLKPNRSKFYRNLADKSMNAAKAITVDSENMKKGVKEISGVNAHIIQNGIDLKSIKEKVDTFQNQKRETVLSIRGFTALYRIEDLVTARNHAKNFYPISFIYPFAEQQYEEVVKLNENDKKIGRVDRNTMYDILSKTLLVVSIPYSDSSPRSVYESIFCGAAVAITYNAYYDILPSCMKKRIILIDLEKGNWFEDAIEEAKEITSQTYQPSDEALDMFDQRRSFKKVYELLIK
ncbi:glycosyltransferase involved in cell wall biosynthesis [Sphingobacterium alimentarium]|uniref:Glycosyltransferase involved in cell wall biosynthesis n=1 Tax=Sphingobacterium alimentarium TaxID=797292 RepID=A0A4R3VW90_9SPHI|nr:glycosyltransferase [Sphingobacterium alimentarium]TCV10493.1 glycosyltransferase involved in cell wall biosynthesis [Sphingobacterium alimentarium]